MKHVVKHVYPIELIAVDEVMPGSALGMVHNHERYILAGLEGNGNFLAAIRWGTLYPVTENSKTLKEWLETGSTDIYFFDSMDELAEWLKR